MSNLDTIFDNIDQYSNNIDDLVAALKQAGINDFDEFRRAARELGLPVKKSIQDQVAEKFASGDSDAWAEATSLDTEDAYWKYLDANPEGEHREEARTRIDELKQQSKAEVSVDIWECLDKSNITEVQNFIDTYPDSAFRDDAARILKELRKDQYLGVDIKALERQMKAIRTDAQVINPEKAIYERIVSFINSGKIKVNDLLDALAEDNNFISGAVANLLWENNVVTDFSRAGIDSDFIAHMMSNITPQKFMAPEPMTRITKNPCTEVYFWGIPSSGKSCALGAILSAANSGKIARSMQRDPDCQGYGYMNRLANLFKTNGSVGTLPAGTAISSTYEMGFNLEDEDGKVHPITCIDLAGELVRCMYKHDAREPLTDEQQNVLQTLTDVLIDNRTDNRKIHFFVIEYGAEDRLYENLPQSVYLDAAVAYIQRTGIFKKDTDGLYLLITKVDKAHAVGEELREKLRAYISDNYQGFYNGLCKICKDNEINGGKVEIQPFTLGSVCFQNYCKFKDETAATVVRTLINRSYGYKTGKLSSIVNKFKK